MRMTERDVWEAIGAGLGAGGSCVLLVVAGSRGSSPSRPGSLMAVGPNGAIAGTIGGGVAESTLVERTAAGLRTGQMPARLVTWEHRRGSPNSSGLVCGGTQTVVVVPLGPAHHPDVRRVIDALSVGHVVEWSADPDGWRVVAEGLDAGPGKGPGPGLGEGHGPGPGLVGDSRHWSYAQRSGPTHTVHVIGAGNVGAALASLLMSLDFRVVIVDERPSVDLAHLPAHERLRLDYEDLASVVPTGPASFVAIMTHAHERDAACLAALRDVELGYLGLLGSRAKVARVAADPPAWFHGPIGLPIGSRTPAEIAVSVAAQMVGIRADAVTLG